MKESESLGDARSTVAYEVVVRFFAGAQREAHGFMDSIYLPEQADFVRLDRIVVPDDEERISERIIGRSKG